MVHFPYNTNEFAFTLDEVFLDFTTNNFNTFFNVKITINYYNFYESTANVKILEYKVVLFNNAQKYYVGDKIHRFLAKPETYFGQQGFQYKTAKVSFLITEVNLTTETILNTFELNNVNFIAGPKPKIVENNNAVLSTNTHYERVTNAGFFLVNFLLSSGEHIIKVLKNGVEVESETKNIVATDFDNVFSIKIDIKELSGAKGYIFEIQLNDSMIKKSVVIFPDGEQSNQLVFVDQFNLFRSLQCTGHYSFPTKYNQITHKYKHNLKEILKIITTEKEDNLKINTGFILKTSSETVDTLSSEKEAYLVIENTVVLDLAVLANSLTKENSEEALYEYNLQFRINKNHA